MKLLIMKENFECLITNTKVQQQLFECFVSDGCALPMIIEKYNLLYDCRFLKAQISKLTGCNISLIC